MKSITFRVYKPTNKRRWIIQGVDSDGIARFRSVGDYMTSEEARKCMERYFPPMSAEDLPDPVEQLQSGRATNRVLTHLLVTQPPMFFQK